MHELEAWGCAHGYKHRINTQGSEKVSVISEGLGDVGSSCLQQHGPLIRLRDSFCQLAEAVVGVCHHLFERSVTQGDVVCTQAIIIGHRSQVI